MNGSYDYLIPDPHAEVKRYILDRVKVAARLNVNSHVWQSAEVFQRELPGFFNELLLGIEAEVMAFKLPPREITKEFTFQYGPTPVTWWDHFKYSHDGAWYLKWAKPPKLDVHEVTKTATVTLDQWWKFPEARHFPRSLGQSVYHTEVRDTWS